MGLRCAAYKSLDWFKQTWLASKLIFHGQGFRRFEVIAIEGVVLAREHQATDGDLTFNIQTDALVYGNPSLQWHCEVTPCSSDDIHAKAAALQQGQRVSITGNRLWDGLHLSHPAHWEIHPVTDILKLT